MNHYLESHYRLLITKDHKGHQINLDQIRLMYCINNLIYLFYAESRMLIINLFIFGSTRRFFFILTQGSEEEKIQERIDCKFNVFLKKPEIISLQNVLINHRLVVFNKSKIYSESLNDYHSIEGYVVSDERYQHSNPLKFTKGFIKKRKKAYLKKQLELPVSEQQEKCFLLVDSHYINFTHFFVEMMPKLYFVKDIVENSSLIVPQDCEFIEPVLKAFGLEKNMRIASPKEGELLEIKNLIITKRTKFHKELFCDALNHLIDFYSKDLPKVQNIEKLYIARRAGRNFANLDEVEDIICNKYGFTKLYFEDFNLTEKIAIMKNVKYVISVLSVGLTNVIFARSDIKVLEIAPVDADSFMSIVYSLMEFKVDYHRLIAKKEMPNIEWYSGKLIINKEDLEIAIKTILQEKMEIKEKILAVI